MLDETSAELALRLDPCSALHAAKEKARQSHVEAMTEKAGGWLFGLDLAEKDGVLSTEEANGFRRRIVAVVNNAENLSAQHLYDISEEMTEATEKGAALKHQREADAAKLAELSKTHSLN